MQPLIHGVYQARLARNAKDIDAALALRHMVFRRLRGLQTATGDADDLDDTCQHGLVTNILTGDLVCCFRAFRFASGQEVARSYSARFYDLTALQGIASPLIELGRFCLNPDHRDPDILRLAWAALTRLVDQDGAAMLFGCSSFDGADPAPHRAALAWLARHHLAPAGLRMAARAPDRIDLAALAAHAPDVPPPLPPLLRTYLGMGGWVSVHAVLDRDLNTLHVFTGLDVSAIPPARARALRALAALPHAPS